MTQAYATSQARAQSARRPAPALRISAAVHAAGALAVALHPESWQWVGGALAQPGGGWPPGLCGPPPDV